MVDLLKISPQELITFLRENGIRRFHFVYNQSEKKCKPSHEVLQPIADFLNGEDRDYLEHEGIFIQITKEHDVLQGAFVHRTQRGQGAGGTRFWGYNTVEDFLRDGLRLSAGMTHKNALAGLWWGGGKGVIARNSQVDNRDPQVRQAIFQEYGELMTDLRGCYVTAEDVGTTTTDIGNIFATTRFVTCLPLELGGSGNPSTATARGVVRGMEAAVEMLNGSSLSGKTIGVQGMGHVGIQLIQFLFEKNVAQVIACDINPDLVAQAEKEFFGKNLQASVVSKGDNSILETSCDILAPCATGAILTPQSIPNIKAKIICGAANNQLEDAHRDDRLIFERGILYVPDFLVNRMGIVNCSNEQYGYVKNDQFIERHLDQEWEYSIYQKTLKVLKLARENGEPPAHTAIKLADELSILPHPIFGHRGQKIIDSLIKDQWFKS